MKKVKLFALAASTAFCMLFLSQNMSAQKLKFDSNTSFTKISAERVSYKCEMESISSLGEAKTFAANLAANKGVIEATASNFSAGKAQLTVVLPITQSLYMYKTILVKMGVNTIYVDGKAVKTEEVMNAAGNLEKH